ncbi:MAG: hypothetical protein HY001_03360 [Candidatus Portnoybacteria bacterium]|nr:hypothetical protein [Candidatus Portnoybacteria bacterium]
MEDVLDQDFIGELKTFIQNSSLSDDDKNFWVEALKNAAPEVAISILSYFQDFPDKIQWATDMLKRKVEAIKSKDENAWNQILTEEEAELEKIANG